MNVMKTASLVLVVAGAVVMAGCHTSHKTGTEIKTAAPTKSASQEMENKTVEFVQNSEADVRHRMEQWGQEGWTVLSISEPMPQSDGTVLRRAQLSRRKS
jgi:hypothetical protein